MYKFVRKVMIFAGCYVISQLILMLLIWLFFGMNLFETSQPTREISDFETGELKLFVTLNQLFGLFLPAFLFLIYHYSRDSLHFIRWTLPKRYDLVLYALGALMFSFPIIQALAIYNTQLPLADWMSDTSGEIARYMEELTVMESPIELIQNLVIIALIPALSEELLFRGVMQNEVKQWFKSTHLSVLLTAIAFSAFHFQFDGFLPRLFLGALFGYVYAYGRNFFLPFIMHFTNNAILIVAVYFKSPDSLEDKVEEVAINYPVLAGSSLIVLFLIHLIRKEMKHEN